MDRKRKTADGFEVRTDLALEERESFKGDGGEVSGVALREWERDRSQARFTEVKIINEQGARAMGKPVGTYLTLEADQLSQKDEEYHRRISRELAGELSRLMRDMLCREGAEGRRPLSVLAVGLGNSQVTPDSLGPRVLGNLRMTRHLEKREADGSSRKEDFWPGQEARRGKKPQLSGIVPGVMAQTGMETAEILKDGID